MKSQPKFRSKFEETVYNAAIKAKKKLEFEPYKIPYHYTVNYIPDMVLPNGVIVECKGYFPSRDRVKMMAVKDSNPHLDIRMLFMKVKTPLRKGSKMTYGDWCIKYGFTYAEGLIPLEWWK